MSLLRVMFAMFGLVMLSGCTAVAVTGAVVGTAAAVVVEVVEVPFEVAGGVHDIMTDDDDEEEDEDDEGG